MKNSVSPKSAPRVSKIAVLSVLVILVMPDAVAQETSQSISPRYTLESLDVVGTDRLTTEQAAEEFGLKPGAMVDDDLVLQTRQRVLTMGIFKSAVLLLKRGSERGKVRLILQVEDDPDVLTDWGIGGELGLVYRDAQAVNANTEGPPLGYRIGLVARSLFGAFHRASALFDLDGDGIARSSRLIYGLPRFAAEDVQFDIEAHMVDVNHRYLDSSAFGSRFQAMWTTSAGDYEEFRYGTAMYLNRGRYSMPLFPTSLAGPKIGYSYETRLNGFLPGAGQLTSVSLLYAPIEAKLSVLEADLARTWQIAESSWLSLSADLVGVGVAAYSARFESRFDMALTDAFSKSDQAGLYVRLRAGQDEVKGRKFYGTAALIGVRYHSAGLIADLGFHITHSPLDLGLVEFIPASGGNE
jgi:hypothetical protein